MPVAKVFVAIYNEGLGFKHWSLFVDGPTIQEKFILHVMGSSTRYYFEERQSDAHKSTSLVEAIPVSEVDVSKILAIKEAGKNAIIHNEHAGYNCQDYVLELLTSLVRNGIIAEDDYYQKQRAIVESKVEGLA